MQLDEIVSAVPPYCAKNWICAKSSCQSWGSVFVALSTRLSEASWLNSDFSMLRAAGITSKPVDLISTGAISATLTWSHVKNFDAQLAAVKFNSNLTSYKDVNVPMARSFGSTDICTCAEASGKELKKELSNFIVNFFLVNSRLKWTRHAAFMRLTESRRRLWDNKSRHCQTQLQQQLDQIFRTGKLTKLRKKQSQQFQVGRTSSWKIKSACPI